jgi:hypothetical protein
VLIRRWLAGVEVTDETDSNHGRDMGNTFVLKGQINDPPRSSWLGAVVLIGIVIALAAAQVLPGSWSPWAVRATILMLPLAIASKSIYTVHCNVFVFFFLLPNYFPHFSQPPFNFVTCLILYAYVVVLLPEMRRTVGWLRLGKFGAKTWMLLAAIIVVSGGALGAWVHEDSPDLSRYAGMVPKFTLWGALIYGLGFSAFNAALEEITWRGVMMEALDSALGAGYWALAIQALSFGLAHYRSGFPNGIEGSAMAFAYGLMLGFIRRKTRGMLACWMAHVAADAAIFCLILAFAHASVK